MTTKSAVSGAIQGGPGTPGASASGPMANAESRSAYLAACVAWLNAPPDGRRRSFEEQWLEHELHDLDVELCSPAPQAELSTRFDAWLETAGEIGGPEREQDPLLPHPHAWHSWRGHDYRH